MVENLGSLVLSEHEKQAFYKLLGAFKSAPLLAHFNPKLPIRLRNRRIKMGYGRYIIPSLRKMVFFTQLRSGLENSLVQK